jgi:hypothetical protein
LLAILPESQQGTDDECRACMDKYAASGGIRQHLTSETGQLQDLLPCAFCNEAYHNEPECIGALYPVPANDDPWACPVCVREAQKNRLVREFARNFRGRARETADKKAGVKQKKATKAKAKATATKAQAGKKSTSKKPKHAAKSVARVDGISNLKVAELKARLKSRGLQITGLKATLAERLAHAVAENSTSEDSDEEEQEGGGDEEGEREEDDGSE